MLTSTALVLYRHILVVYKLNDNQSNTIRSILVKKDLLAFSALHESSDSNLLMVILFRNIPHVVKPTVYKNPLAVMEVKISYRLLIGIIYLLVCSYIPVYMPQV